MEYEPQKMPEIAAFLPDLRPGGAEKLHVDLAHAWDSQGFKTVFLLRNAKGSLLDSIPASSLVVDFKSPRVRDVLIPLVRYLKESPPDALIAAMWPLTVIAPIAAKIANFKGRVLVSEHSPLSIAYSQKGIRHRLLLKATMGFFYRLADKRIAVSEGVATDIAALSMMKRGQFDVVNNPAALGNVRPELPPPELLRTLDGPVFLTVGTLKEVKKHDLLIEAFALVPQELKASLVILGDGALKENLISLINKLGLGNKVFMPGFQSDTGPWYANADLFVLSSSYEGFGNVIVEALEYGLPVVSTDCPAGPREILDDGRYGTLVEPDNAVLLAKAMVDKIAEKPKRSLLRSRANDFSICKISNRYLDLCFPERSISAGYTSEKN